MVICPGIANHSEKQYIRTFVDYAQKNGYRCAVLNHLGALPNIELTSPRMFTYGKNIWISSLLFLCYFINYSWAESSRISVLQLKSSITS